MKKTVIASHLRDEAVRRLHELQIDVFDFAPNPSLDDTIAHHADLSFLYHDGRLYIAREMQSYRDYFLSLGIDVCVIPEPLGKVYPDDVKLNAVPLGRFFLCNEKTVSPFVLADMKRKGKIILSVPQGYTRCSVVPVTDESLITDDASIFAACRAHGLDVLQVGKGSVRLPGFPYGFIGGASGRISDKRIVFHGNLALHQDYEKMARFLEKYAMTAVSLHDGDLIDVGGILSFYK